MKSLNQYVVHYAKTKPDSVFLKYHDLEITYREALELINSVSSYLTESGYSGEKSVGLLLPNIPEFVISYLSILQAGGRVVLLPIALPPAELATFINRAEVELLIYSEELHNKVAEVESILNGTVKKVVVGSKQNKDPENFRSLTQNRSLNTNIFPHNENDEAVIIFTSGTTAFPKGVVLSHDNIISNAEACSELISFDKERRLLAMLPFYYSMGHTVVMNTTLIIGGTLILSTKFSPENALFLIKKEKVSIFAGVPTMFKKIANLPGITESALSTLKVCICGGDCLPCSTIDFWTKRLNRVFLEGYGLTEASPVVSFNQNLTQSKAESIGLPLSCNQMRIVNELGAEVAVGEIGELQIRGRNVMLRYLEDTQNHPSANTDWFSTGDLMRQDEDDYYYYMGRESDQISKYGYTIHPKTIEDVILKHPKVKETVAIPLDSTNIHKIKICIVPEADKEISVEEMFEYARENLPKYLYPDIIQLYKHFPKNCTGKVLRRRLLSEHLEI